MTPAAIHHELNGSPYLNSPLRQDLYVLLSHLLLQPPSGHFIRRLADLDWDSDVSPGLAVALDSLRTSAGRYSPGSVGHEFEDLFIGMGRGEVVPYASWYAEKLLMGAPLVELREDLAKIRIGRQANVYEPEDHAAALCEIMALMIQRPEISPAQQAAFFDRHMHPWMIQFFRDLQQAPSARFYGTVGSLGEHFLRVEKLHLQTK